MKFVILIFIAMTNLYANDFEADAKKLLMPIKKAFMSELKAGMSEGPYNALDVCHLKAPHLIEHKNSDKYEIGRSSNKIRNPQNKPQEWMEEILKDYLKTNADAPKSSGVYKVLKNKQVYVEPIYIKGLCLNCHGPSKGSVAKKIKKLYPNDQAVDYKIGEFRGLFYVLEK